MNSAVIWFFIRDIMQYCDTFWEQIPFFNSSPNLHLSNELTKCFFVHGVHVVFSQVILSKKKGKLLRRTKKYLAAVSSHLYTALQVLRGRTKSFLFICR